MRVPCRRRRASAAIVVTAALALSPAASAQETGRVVPDQSAVRFVSPETGGADRPRFITQRELAFLARLEALSEQIRLGPGEYPDRYVRAATDRFVAQTMLASLLVERGSEPDDLPKRAAEARVELADRLGSAAVLEEAMRLEGISEDELTAFLRDRVRALTYIDKAITPIVAVTEDQLREAFRSAIHPYRGASFDEVRDRLKRWLVGERLRAAELEFLQSARARVKITAVRGR